MSSSTSRTGRTTSTDRARVLEAQWAILFRLGKVEIADHGALAAYACQHAELGRADSHTALPAKEADALIRHFGQRIRGARDAA